MPLNPSKNARSSEEEAELKMDFGVISVS
jgi:hypothetical protein